MTSHPVPEIAAALRGQTGLSEEEHSDRLQWCAAGPAQAVGFSSTSVSSSLNTLRPSACAFRAGAATLGAGETNTACAYARLEHAILYLEVGNHIQG
jgi:hypothetical protein